MASVLARGSRRLVSSGTLGALSRSLRTVTTRRPTSLASSGLPSTPLRAQSQLFGQDQNARISTHLSAVQAAVAEPVGTAEDDDSSSDATRQTFSSLFSVDVEDVEEAVVDESLLLVNCGLSDVTVKALEARGIRSMFPVQKRVFEPAMAGQDLIARARTGSGKTLAFALPVAEKIMAERGGAEGRARGRAPLCVVLAPTRELATQVEREFASVAPRLATACLYGGAPAEAQRRALRAGVDVVVGTPGRVIDLVEQGALDLTQVRFAILDEADQMLAIGFAEDTERILGYAPRERQTMLFSATTPAWIKKLVASHLRAPVNIDLIGQGASGKLAESITAHAIQVAPEVRRSVLVDVLTVYGAGGKSIVFTQTKREADEVAAGVSSHLPCSALHGDMSQAEREKVLRAFRRGGISVLVATDVAARGLDIPDVDLVVHYELPQDAESFLHRSGRTGRAGKDGVAIAMFTRREAGWMKRILRETGTAGVTLITAPTAVQVMEAAARQVMTRLDGVEEEVRAFFRPVARRILASREPAEALEAALAALSGIKEVPEPRSLLTQEEGLVTLRLSGRRGRISRPAQVSAVVGGLADAAAPGGARVALGRIRMLPALSAEEREEGAAFDVPAAAAPALLAAAEASTDLAGQGLTLDMPDTLPPEEDLYGRDSSPYAGSRGPPRGGRSGGNARYSSDNRRGGYGGGGGSGGYSNDRRSSSGSGGGYGRRPASGGSGSGYRSGGDRWSGNGGNKWEGGGGDRNRRPSSGGARRSSSSWGDAQKFGGDW